MSWKNSGTEPKWDYYETLTRNTNCD